jgi:hypothetical protein
MDDSKIARLRRRYQGLSRISAAINDLYLYGIYPGNFPNLTAELEQAKDKVKEVIQETKKDIATIEGCEPVDDQPTDPFKSELIDKYTV